MYINEKLAVYYKPHHLDLALRNRKRLFVAMPLFAPSNTLSSSAYGGNAASPLGGIFV
jgi:hypothetical protein